MPNLILKCGVAIYVQNNIPAKIRQDLMLSSIEILWLQVQFPHHKPMMIGCCYRPPGSIVQYTDDKCHMLLNVTDRHEEIYLLGDFNIDWFTSCALKDRLVNILNTCNLCQIVNVPTRIASSLAATVSKSCIDHIYTNVGELCSDFSSLPISFSDHNIVAFSRK